MFNNISWQSYWIVVALLSAGYYLSIYLLYYRSDFKIALFGKLGATSSTAIPSSSLPGSLTVQESVPSANEEYVFDSCLNELAAFFEEAKNTKWKKEELVFSLQKIFRKYSNLKNSTYEESLRRVIVCQAEDICSIPMDAGDVKKVWSDSQ